MGLQLNQALQSKRLLKSVFELCLWDAFYFLIWISSSPSRVSFSKIHFFSLRLRKSFSSYFKHDLMLTFSRIYSRTSWYYLASIRSFSTKSNYLSFLLLMNSRTGIPLSNWRPKEWTKLSTKTISSRLRFLIILKSLILNPFTVSRQFFLWRTPWIVLFLLFKYATIGSA